MKKILIPLSAGKFPNDEIFIHIARETYLKKLNDLGYKVHFISYVFPLEHARDEYDKCDGVLLMGGGDFNPKIYHSEVDKNCGKFNVKQDGFELSILQWVITEKKPFLGICRGCQALGIACGGKLIQHIPDRLEEIGISNEFHGLSEGGTYSSLTSQDGHDVNIVPGSKANKILNVDKLKINSGHHQAVEFVGDGFAISGTSNGGITEVIESVDESHFCFGIQGHPEALSDSVWDKFFNFEI